MTTKVIEPHGCACPSAPLERAGHIHEPDGETGRTRFYVRQGQEPSVGFPAIVWRDEAVREWLEGLASGRASKRH